MKNKLRLNVVSYCGYAYSGGIVAGLILREFRNVRDAGFYSEFRILREKGGLFDLADAVRSKDPELVDLAIKHFEWLCRHYSKKRSLLSRSGFGYDSDSNNRFTESLREFLESIVTTRYPMNWHYYDFMGNPFTVVFFRVLNRLASSYRFGRRTAVGTSISTEEFYRKAEQFLTNVISGFGGDDIKEHKFTLLPKAIDPFTSERVAQAAAYFENIALVFVDRDPRDVFAQILTTGKGRYLPYGMEPECQAEEFVRLYRSQREEKASVSNLPNVLMLNFEDVCLNYHRSCEAIYALLGAEDQDHVRKGKLFSPSESCKNIGLWKDLPARYKPAVSIIELGLEDFLYA